MDHSQESFILYTDYIHSVMHLPMEQRGLLLTAALCYVNHMELPELDLATVVLWEIWKNNIDRNAEKWEEVRQRRSAAGRKGGLAPRHQSQAEVSIAEQCQPGEAVTGNVPVTVPVTVPVKEDTTPSPPHFIALPVKNGGNYVVTSDDVAKFARQFPGLNVPAVLQNILRWLEDNPGKRKTADYMPTFLHTWLARDAKAYQRKGTSPHDSALPPLDQLGTVL